MSFLSLFPNKLQVQTEIDPNTTFLTSFFSYYMLPFWSVLLLLPSIQKNRTPANTHVGAMLLVLFPLKKLQGCLSSRDQWLGPATINLSRNYSMPKTNQRFRQPAWTFLERKTRQSFFDPNLPFFLLINSSKRSTFYFFLPQTKPSKLLTLSPFFWLIRLAFLIGPNVAFQTTSSKKIGSINGRNFLVLSQFVSLPTVFFFALNTLSKASHVPL